MTLEHLCNIFHHLQHNPFLNFHPSTLINKRNPIVIPVINKGLPQFKLPKSQIGSYQKMEKIIDTHQ